MALDFFEFFYFFLIIVPKKVLICLFLPLVCLILLFSPKSIFCFEQIKNKKVVDVHLARVSTLAALPSSGDKCG